MSGNKPAAPKLSPTEGREEAEECHARPVWEHDPEPVDLELKMKEVVGAHRFQEGFERKSVVVPLQVTPTGWSVIADRNPGDLEVSHS